MLPVLATLGTVAPDLHDLLTVSRELNDMLAKIPGMGRLKRRIDEEEGEDGTDACRSVTRPEPPRAAVASDRCGTVRTPARSHQEES